MVAVSGGVDSMALLHAIHTLSTKHSWELIVAHLNHRLRGRASAGDEALVARTAKRLGLRFESESADVKTLAKKKGISLEMAARELRHEFLARTARACGIRHVLLAHHADDQVELFFLRLFRGAGAQGLGGMEWSAPSPSGRDVVLLRPLLGETKSALIDYIRENKIEFRADATNRSTDILRNRIRRELLPLLRRRYQPQMDRAVLRSMELIHDEGEFVTHEAIAWRKKRKKIRFENLPVSLQRRVVQLGLIDSGVRPQFEHVEQLRTRPNEWVTLRAGLVCRRKINGELESRAVEAASFRRDEMVIDLEAPDRFAVFAGVRLSWRLAQKTKLPQRGAGVEFFDAACVGKRIVLRHWRPGDRFQPIGLAHSVKLQDFFVNQKIPRAHRYKMVLATTEGGEIIWVEGLRIGERFKVTLHTKRLLQWTWRVETQVAVTTGG